MPDAPAHGGTPGWRSIDELAERVGHYCWLEQHLFEVTGEWATAPAAAGPGAEEPPAPEFRVWCAATSRRHGLLAARWTERLPVRAGVDAAGLVAPPPGAASAVLTLAEAEADDAGRLTGLVGSVLPWLVATYEAHLAAASPVCEAPVIEVLVEARRSGLGEIGGGRSLLGRLPRGPASHAAPSSGAGERTLSDARPS